MAKLPTGPTPKAPATAPVVEAPATAPVVEAPATAPVVEAPATAPVVEAPATAPVVEAPVTPPVVEAPVVEATKPDVSKLSRVVKVKSKAGGKVLSVSRGYYERNSHKLDLVK